MNRLWLFLTSCISKNLKFSLFLKIILEKTGFLFYDVSATSRRTKCRANMTESLVGSLLFAVISWASVSNLELLFFIGRVYEIQRKKILFSIVLINKFSEQIIHFFLQTQKFSNFFSLSRLRPKVQRAATHEVGLIPTDQTFNIWLSVSIYFWEKPC